MDAKFWSDVRIVLKWILARLGVKEWTGFNCLRIEPNVNELVQ
jgi:hypothetical protein